MSGITLVRAVFALGLAAAIGGIALVLTGPPALGLALLAPGLIGAFAAEHRLAGARPTRIRDHSWSASGFWDGWGGDGGCGGDGGGGGG